MSLCSCLRILTRYRVSGGAGHGRDVTAALVQANPARVVYLSTIGAQAKQSNLLTQHTIIEKAIGGWPNPVTFLRPAWFMENSSWDVAPAREQGVIPSFLQPLDRPVPMVGTADIGKVAAELLQVAVERSSRGGTRRAAACDAE